MFKFALLIIALVFIPLYPKFPFLGVGGTFVSVRLEDFLIAFIIGIWFMYRIFTGRQKLHLPHERAVLLYLFVGLVSLASAVFITRSASLNLGLLHWARRVEYLLFFFIAYDFLSNKAQLLLAAKTLIVISVVVALYGLGQQYLGLPVISTTNSEFSKGLTLSLGPGARINSTFAGHYDLAAFSIFPLLLITVLLSLPIRHKFILLPLGGLIYWAMLLSASRVTFAAYFLTAGLFLIVIRKYIWLIPLLAIGVCSVLATPQLLGRYRELIINHLLVVATPVSAQSVSPAPTPVAVDDQTADSLKPPPVPEDRSLNIRLKAEWPRAIRAIIKNPLLGTGYSSVGLAVDNDYLRLLAETGILGFFAFLLIILRIFKTSAKFIFSTPQTVGQGFIVAVTFGLLGLMLNAVFIDVFEASKIATVSWLLLGLAEKAKTYEN